MQIRRRGPQARQLPRRVDDIDRWKLALAGPLRPFGKLRASVQHPEASCRPERQARRAVWLSKVETGAIVLRRIHADPVELRLCRLAPAADNRQLPAAVEQTRRVEFCLDSFVTQCRVAATEVNLVVRAHEMEVAEAER